LIASLFATLIEPDRIKNILLYDMGFHHGGGIEEIITSSFFKHYCHQKGLRIVYYSTYHQNAYDSQQDESINTTLTHSSRVQVIRRYSSKPFAWSKKKTQERLDETCQFLQDNAARFDIILVAAGFDHCRGEQFMRTNRQEAFLWTLDQVRNLGQCIRNAASKTIVGHAVACLEGGYERSTLVTFVPVLLEALGIHVRTPILAPSTLSYEYMSNSDESTDSDKELCNHERRNFIERYKKP
jgi:acetoin utilization deacetylase AcuC-like enzyme